MHAIEAFDLGMLLLAAVAPAVSLSLSVIAALLRAAQQCDLGRSEAVVESSRPSDAAERARSRGRASAARFANVTLMNLSIPEPPTKYSSRTVRGRKARSSHETFTQALREGAVLGRARSKSHDGVTRGAMLI